MQLRNSPEKRKTSKWIILFNHRKYWKCVILVKEKDWKYWLPWWWINRGEDIKNALKRELREELWRKFNVELMHQLFNVTTPKQYHNVYALKLNWELTPSKDEIKWFAFYPLDSRYKKERKELEREMERYAQDSVHKFMNKPNRETYQASPVTFNMNDLIIFYRYKILWALKL